MGAVRQDVATLGAGWNKTLLNYALAMRALDELPISNRNSWKFLGAMHGFDEELWRGEELIGTGPVPADLTNGTYGDQCQHGSWYFLPWHRGYLATFEAIVAAKVKELTGDDWALPYWNYLDASNPEARKVPAAFIADKLPNGDPNPLKTYPRRPGLSALQPGRRDAFSLAAAEETDFTVDGGIGYGGGITGDFIQFGNWTGDIENNPHNTVHRLVGGYMTDPRLAGLDPLFWLHHCNIDRMWEAWMRAPGKKMTRDSRWRDGPADRLFLMPQLGGADPGITFGGSDTLTGGRFHPTYDDLTKGTGVVPGAVAVARVGMGPSHQQTVEPIGANAGAVSVGSKPESSLVTLEPQATTAGVAAMGATTPGAKVSRFYLALEAVRGQAPAPQIDVYVNLPEGADPDAHPELHAGNLTMFGLNVASRPHGRHAGNGLGYTLDITELAQRLKQAGDFDPSKLRVTLVPGEHVSDQQPITVDKISVLKRTGTVS